jgi:glutamyl-tRNA synthetase
LGTRARSNPSISSRAEHGAAVARNPHVPLVVGHDGMRLAKRHGDTSLCHLRERGASAEAVVGFLARSCGLRATAAPCSARELIEGFDLAHVPKGPVRGDDHGLLT